MDRTANPLFKAGLAAITATTLVVAPTVAPPTRQAISLPDIRSASVRLSAFTLTPQAAQAPVSPLTALKLPLSLAVPDAAKAPTSPPRLASIGQLAPSVQPRAAVVQSPAPVGVPVRSGAGPAVANSITNGIDQAYQFVQYWVDYGVNLAQWGAGFVPVIGGLVSAQIGIVYDNLVRPIANSFVYNLVDPIINDPSFSNIVNSFGRFGGDIVNSVINFAWAEVRYLLPPLPPLPGLALQATPNADGTLSASVHEALAPFTKAFKDAEAHFSEALGLTKTDAKLTTLEKTGTAAQTTAESSKDTTKETPKEDGKATDAGAAVGVKDTKEAQDSKVSAEGKVTASDKATTVADKKTGDTTKTDGTKTDAKETTVEGTKESPKDATTPAAATGADGTSGDGTTDTKPAKDTVTLKDSAKDPKSSADATPADKPDKTIKPKIPTASTTEHGAISAQGIVRGPVSQSTSGQSGPSTSASKTSDSKVSDSRTSDSKASDSVKPDSATPDTKTTDTKATSPKVKASETKPESKTSGTKSPTSASTHDSTSKSAGSASSSSKSGGEGSTSHGGHD
ncbi:hypothetical protein [Mycobacteroides franklinii]|uniref:hypothetical protein n=1 Tax=Mycobacteroides franklinii TaxID=948102 RepID=UPI000994650B|nr:hypothetical protein [Mycobacteroides franklinii]